MARKIKGILFDLGETLLHYGDFDIPHFFREGARLAYAYLQSIGQPAPPFETYYRKQFRAIKWRYALSHLTAIEFDSVKVMAHLSAKMGQRLTEAQHEELTWLWYRPLGEHATLEDGAREMLADFLADGLVLGVVSNTFVPGRLLDRHLDQVGLLDLLAHRTYSADVGKRKPRRAIFDHALARAGLAAEETIYVGDLPWNDIHGANCAGLISVLKDPAGRHARTWFKPAHRIGHITELRDVVASYDGPGPSQPGAAASGPVSDDDAGADQTDRQ